MPRKTAKMPLHRDPRPLVERNIPQNDKTRKTSRSVTVNLAESPLSWLHSRGHLTDRQLYAGEKLRCDYETAAIGPNITMSWNNMPMSRNRRAAPSPLSQSERVLAAKSRFDAAISALGRDLSDIAWRVICAGEGIPVAERGLGWPARSGKLVLRIALDRLAQHYRLPG
jgi:Domain of unknown function (DUF6456)